MEQKNVGHKFDKTRHLNMWLLAVISVTISK
jgi:hypothetical protein